MEKNQILITGANGLLGGKLVKHLLAETAFDIMAVAASEEKLAAMMEREGIAQTGRIKFLSNAQLLNGDAHLAEVYGAVHLAFARRIRPAAEIADSLVFASNVFTVLARAGIPRIINLSSQGVYGNTEEMRTEQTSPAPENHYTMAKYATEIIFDACMADGKIENCTNLRLDLIAQSQNVIRTLCRDAKAGRLSLRGGEQRFSFLDADDGARAIIAMLQSPGNWERVYNVGWNRRRYTLVEAAKIAADAAEEIGLDRPVIELDENKDIKLWAGMDSSRFMVHTGWTPMFDLCSIIMRILQGIENG